MAKLECPEKRGPAEPVVIICQANVQDNGKAGRGSYCFDKDFRSKLLSGRGASVASRRYVRSTARALKSAKFLPAEIDGEAVPVYFSFQVVFEDDGGCTTTAFPHLGSQVSEFGPLYVAPQEILLDGGWCSRAKSPGFRGNNQRGILYSVSVLVDENGRATDGRVEHVNAVTMTDSAQSGAVALQASKFIPGFYRGMPHSMRYLDMLFR